ncbi:unnamed protein product [Amoebophrya sp. A25]|nr:unnamed protein product [Amoebophrya sp. A25]|eukprot:GSA25T00014542001.1
MRALTIARRLHQATYTPRICRPGKHLPKRSTMKDRVMRNQKRIASWVSLEQNGHVFSLRMVIAL